MTPLRSKKLFRILSLDGGGTWAFIQAKVLANLYRGDPTGHEILKDFDIVAANSGGSIVAAGLIANFKLGEILKLFEEEQTRRHMFSPLPFYRKSWRLLGFGPRFSTDDKLAGLSQVLSGLASNALQGIQISNRNGNPVRFVITAYDYDRDRVVFFRSDRNSPAGNFSRAATPTSVVEAVHASSTAPVNYFDMPTSFGGRQYWDGGVSGFNNPTMAAVVEALGYGVPRERIGVLSIGTGNVFLPVSGDAISDELVQKAPRRSVVNDLEKLAKATVADPPDTATFVAHVMLGGALPAAGAPLPLSDTPVVRLNPLIRPNGVDWQWTRPSGFSADEFSRLVDMDLAITDPKDFLLLNRFCNAWMQDGWPNQPVRHGPDTTADRVPNRDFCEIGYSRYSAGAAAW